jgi:hypothetical protein
MSRADAKISKNLKRILSDVAPDNHQIVLANGDKTQKSYAEVIAEGVVQLAADRKEWAITFIAEYTEGKPTVADKQDGGDSTTEERLRDVTKHHLNALARQFGASDNAAADSATDHQAKPAGANGEAGVVASGLAARILALPKNGAARPKAASRQPEVPAAAAG